MKNKLYGFTLIELLVVIAILGLLASIVLVGVNSARNKGKDSRIISDVRQIVVALGSGWNGTGFPDLKSNANAGSAATGNASCTTNGWDSSGPRSAQIDPLMADICTQVANAVIVNISTNASGSNFVKRFIY